MAGHFTPQLQATMTRLGSKMSFPEAVEEVWYSHQTHVSEATVRRTTYRHGRAAEALERQAVESLERDAPEAPAGPRQLSLCTDGAFVALTNGEWREVKSVAVGAYETIWHEATWESEVKTKDLSYFSRSYRVDDFERYALAELHRRGLEKAETVVAVNDGAEWIQRFLDYHAPAAIRVIDFAHAAGYVAQAGKAVWSEESETFKKWFASACHRLKHKPPQETIANLRLLQPKAKTDEQAAQLAGAHSYLQTRVEMLDYAHFRNQGLPIGSGSVESGHKVVFQRRMKGAGMRWAEPNLDPMLALRNLVCNRRWETGWQQIVLFQQGRQLERRLRMAKAKQPPSPQPISQAMVKAADKLPEAGVLAEDFSEQKPKPWRPAEDHPWRKGIWPTKESWRWN